MKVLKIAAIAVGVVALAATGIGLVAGAGSLAAAFGAGLGAIGLGSVVGAVGLGTLGTIALGALAIDLSMISGALAPKPSTGGNQTKWKADPYAGIPYVMGRTLVGGNIVLKRGHGKSYKYLTAVTVLGLGPFTSIDATFMDKTAVAFSGSGAAIGTYSGQIWQRTQLGACPELGALSSPIGNPAGWTAAHRLSGLAAAINSFAYDGKSENGLTSVPPPSWIAKGIRVYDPRLDSTYPGGSGTCRAWDEATYVFSEDPHLHGLTWSLGRYHNGMRVAGIGVGAAVPAGTIKGIDVASFVEGANLNDARGWKLGGQVYTRPDTPWNSLKAMLQAGGARPVLVGGVISCVNSAPKVSLATITQQDIAGACDFAGTARRRQRINAIIPQYRSEQHDWEMVSAKRVAIGEFEAIDGGERTRELTWPLVQQVEQVSQLAALTIYELREAGPGTVPLKPAWLNYRIGDCVTFAPEDGFALKCAITGRGLDAQTATVTFTLRGETDGKHDYALGLTGTPPPIASLNYVETIDAPDAADWTLSDTQLSANGTTVPALIVSGACDNPAAEAVVVEYRLHSAGQADDAGWLGAAVEAPTLTRKEITSVTTGTAYDVALRYRVRGKLGPRLILGPEVTSDFNSPGSEGPQGPKGDKGDDGKSAYSFRLTNDDMTFPADAAGNVTSYANGHFKVQVFYGNQDVTSSFALGIESNPQNLSIAGVDPNYQVNGGLEPGEDSATVTIKVTGSGAHAAAPVMFQTITVSKSKAGANGEAPPLVTLTSNKAIASYDKGGSYVGGPITFTADRQNTSATIYWEIRRAVDGYGIYGGPAANFLAAYPGYFTASTHDVLAMTAAGVAAFVNGYGAVRIVARAQGLPEVVRDSVTITKTQDGADGAAGQDGIDGTNGTDGVDGTDGIDGQDALSASALPSVLVFRADQNGVIESGQLTRNVGLAAFFGPSIVTGSTTFEVLQTSNTAASISGPTLTISGVAGGEGYVDVRATRSGLSDVVRVTWTKLRRGAAATSYRSGAITSAPSGWNSATNTVTFTYGPEDSAASIGAAAFYEISSNGTVSLQMRILVRNVTDGGAFVQVGPTAVANPPATYSFNNGEPERQGGQVELSVLMGAPPASRKVYEAQVQILGDSRVTYITGGMGIGVE